MLSIGPFLRIDHSGWTELTAPPGARLLADCSTQEQRDNASSIGFFEHSAPLDAEYDLLATDDWRETRLNARLRSALQGRLGLLLAGDTLLDAFVNCFGAQSHPDGLLGPAPMMPNHRGVVGIWMHGKGWVYRQSLANPKLIAQRPALFARIRDRLQLGVAEHHAHSPQLAARYLACVAKKHRLDYPDEYEVLIPQGLRGTLRPSRPQTTYNETWTAANSDTISADLTWTEVSGNHFEIVSNTCRDKSIANQANARAEHDLSSADHYCEASVTLLSDGVSAPAGTATRFSASAGNFFRGVISSGNDDVRVQRVDSNTTVTSLVTEARTTGAGTLTVRLTSDGSNHFVLVGGAMGFGAFDSNYATQVRCGISSFASQNTAWDNWEAADLEAAGGAVPGTVFAQGMQVL